MGHAFGSTLLDDHLDSTARDAGAVLALAEFQSYSGPQTVRALAQHIGSLRPGREHPTIHCAVREAMQLAIAARWPGGWTQSN